MKRHLGEIDNIFYVLCIAALSVTMAAVLLYLCTGFSVLDLAKFFPCFFYNATGIYCPGCGGVRSVKALFRGEIWQSFIDYPPTIYFIVIFAQFTVRCFIRRHFNVKAGPKKDGVILPYIYAGLALVLLQWALKVIAQVAFHYTWIR